MDEYGAVQVTSQQSARVGNDGENPSSSGGVLAERDPGSRMSPLLIILLALLLILLFIVYFAGRTTEGPQDVVELPARENPSSRPGVGSDGARVDIPPSTEQLTGLDQPQIGSVVPVPDGPLSSGGIVLTQAQIENRNLVMMAFNLANQANTRLGYATEIVDGFGLEGDGEFNVYDEISFARNAATYAAEITPIQYFATAHAQLLWSTQKLDEAAVALANGASGASVRTMIAEAKARMVVAQSSMDAVLATFK